MKAVFVVTAFLSLSACHPAVSTDEVPEVTAVITGAHSLIETGFKILEGKRVGIVTNHSAMVGDRHVIDVIHEADDVIVTALFGPEHGIRGDADAGARVADGRDERTGAPVYSLYGDVRKPSAAMLADVDVLVFDIQDIGARFYTYISTMGLAMQAAAENGIPFVVLDRPNPLGGKLVEGFVLEPDFNSFVGMYPIPITHGLTVGELALMIKGERMIPGVEDLVLEVVQLSGWQRTALWEQNDLPWIPPSPNIPTFETALIYPGACFFEGTSASEGRGTLEPFILLGAPWANGEALAQVLNDIELPGLRFEHLEFTPRSIEGMAATPKLLNVPLEGIRIVITDPQAVRPVEAGVHMLSAFYELAPDDEKPTFFNTRTIGLLAGTGRLESAIKQGLTPEGIVALWQEDVEEFYDSRQKYLLYR